MDKIDRRGERSKNRSLEQDPNIPLRKYYCTSKKAGGNFPMF